MIYRVNYSRRALKQLKALHDYIAEQGKPKAALSFINSIFDYCDSFALFPMRGVARDDIREGMRVVGFNKRATIIIRVDPDVKCVTIIGIFYGGQDVDSALLNEN